MQLTVTIDFYLPRDADKLAGLADVLTGARVETNLPGEKPPVLLTPEETRERARVDVPAPIVRKRGRPAKTAVVPVPEVAPEVELRNGESAVFESVVPAPEAAPAPGQWTLGPTCGSAETVTLAPGQAAHTWEVTATDDNTRVYKEETPALTLDDVKAALSAYFEKDKIGAINLVRSYGVQQYTQVPPEKFAEFVAKCKDGLC